MGRGTGRCGRVARSPSPDPSGSTWLLIQPFTDHASLFGPWFHLCLRCSPSAVQPPPVIFIPAG